MEVLVLYYSSGGSVREMALRIARGIESVNGITARVRTVPKVSTNCEATEPDVPNEGDPYVEISDLEECDSDHDKERGSDEKRQVKLEKIKMNS